MTTLRQEVAKHLRLARIYGYWKPVEGFIVTPKTNEATVLAIRSIIKATQLHFDACPKCSEQERTYARPFTASLEDVIDADGYLCCEFCDEVLYPKEVDTDALMRGKRESCTFVGFSNWLLFVSPDRKDHTSAVKALRDSGNGTQDNYVLALYKVKA
jgi:hypothetical protein